ncbi:UNVERIFIED_CONTAM: hypothetical protein Slati_3937200 [Sesamum latifolium]|uniref:Uncharacterized protein n=1 Tax=Sesamum latifolium TaxID=2727402 RepID=A0AAW2TPS1_9LAMI
MFFAKICSPWRKMLIQSYKVPKGRLDSVARRMSFLKDKLKDWCYKASIQKNMKSLREESSKPRKRKKQNSDSYPRSSKRISFIRRSWWSKSKARSYKSGQRTGPTRATSQGSNQTDARSTGRTLQEELLDESIPEPMKVSRTVTAGPAEQNDMSLQTARRTVLI